MQKNKTKLVATTETPTPSIEQRITTKFGGITIPKDADTADLTASSTVPGVGIATRMYQNGKFSVTVLSDLDTPKEGYFYQAWITKDGLSFVSMGKLRVGKGGYMTDFESATDYSDYKKVIVSLEKVLNAKPEQYILEGSF